MIIYPIFNDNFKEDYMSDFYKEMLQKSIERQAKDIVETGATENDRYGNLLDSVKGRDLEQEEASKRQKMIDNVQHNSESLRQQRKNDNETSSNNLKHIVGNIQRREIQEKNDFLIKHSDRLKKAEETIRKERNKSYFN